MLNIFKPKKPGFITAVILMEESTVDNKPLVVYIPTNTKTLEKLKEFVSKGVSLDRNVISLKYAGLDHKYEALDTDIKVELLISEFAKSGENISLTCFKSIRNTPQTGAKRNILKEKLAEKYNVKVEQVESLGKGSYGFVFGVCKEDKPIAVKVLFKESMQKNDSTEELNKEVVTSISLKHEHIVEVFNFYQLTHVKHFHSVMCYEMERMLGTLKTFFLEKDKHPITDVLAIMIINQICQAFQMCVTRKIQHRDIKPDNILVKSITQDCIHVALADFGCAFTSFDANTKIESAGTQDYLAPELIEDCTKFSIKSDLFSLGITMYHLLVGNSNEVGSDLCNIPDQVQKTLESKKVSTRVIEIILGMIKKDPKDRFSLDELIQLTNDHLNNETREFSLRVDQKLFKIVLPLYPKFDELVKIIEKKLKYKFSLTHNQEIVTNETECKRMMTNILSKEPKYRVITLKLTPINDVLKKASDSYCVKRYDLALENCEQYISRENDSLQVATTAAYCCFHLANYEKALYYFNSCVENWKSNHDQKFYERFAFCYFTVGKYEKAFKLYKKVVSNDFQVLYYAGFCAMKANQYEKSVVLLSKAYTLRKNNHFVNSIVQVLEQLDTPEEIYSWTEEGIALFALGLLTLKKSNETEIAKELLEKALEKMPNDLNIENALRSIP